MTEWKSTKYWRNRPVEERVQNARIPTRYKGKKLSTYDLETGDKAAFDAVSSWAKNIEKHIEDGMGLYLYGPTGVGKTHLAQAALTYILEKHTLSGLFVTADRYTDMIYDEIRNNGELPESYSDPNLLKYLRRMFDIVVLDGLGSERSSKEFTRNSLVTLVDNRYEQKLVTIITSVMPPQELGRNYGKKLPSILQESCFFIQVDGVDHRTVFSDAG
jgi:DNA replication protein DnaC